MPDQPSTEELAAIIAEVARKSDAAHWPEAVASVVAGIVREAQEAAWADGHESGFWNGRLSRNDSPERDIGIEHARKYNPYSQGHKE